ncbi:Insertion element protein [Auraticoccus sp. F435]|uniref:Insertion element protein n=1 Tax=Auraticoccus cholistanensis TaxID=2656650 RepID=A0A6A9UV78_9ACTN|nr:Insertion element protein [Auraticoccus cholistanensis]MVA76743.1 Insertion element protein [Auraticoccus cholistanensis]
MSPAAGAPAPRSPVFHCPYCGEEDLRPSEEHPAGWRCSSCARVFSVQLHQIDRLPDERSAR